MSKEQLTTAQRDTCPHTHIPALNVEHSFLLSSWKKPERETKEILMSETSVTVSTRNPPRRSMSRERNFRGMRAARAQTDNRRKPAPPTGYTRAKSLPNDGYERLWSPSSQALVIGRVINHQTALLRLYTVSNMNHNRNYGCYGRLWTCKKQPWPICYTSPITEYKTGERLYNTAYY